MVSFSSWICSTSRVNTWLSNRNVDVSISTSSSTMLVSHWVISWFCRGLTGAEMHVKMLSIMRSYLLNCFYWLMKWYFTSSIFPLITLITSAALLCFARVCYKRKTLRIHPVYLRQLFITWHKKETLVSAKTCQQLQVLSLKKLSCSFSDR